MKKGAHPLCVPFFLVLLFLAPTRANAIEIYHGDGATLDLKGYYKNLSFASHADASDKPYGANLNRLRTEWDGTFDWVSAKLIWDNEFIAGDYVRSAEFDNRQVVRRSPFLDTDYELSRKRSLFYGQALYRAYLKVDPGPFVLTLGRQKIDWGVGRFLSVGDLFTPLSLFDFEKEERTGSDAANLLVPIGETTRVNLVYTLDNNFDNSRTGLRLATTFDRFDVSLFGGRFQEDLILGIDFSADVATAGLRGEGIFSVAHQDRNFAQASLGIDYGFANTLYLAGEYFINGQAENEQNPDLANTTFSAQPIKTQYRHFFSSKITYDFSPLWTGQLMAIWDVQGSSVFINPETAYSVFSWMEVRAGALLPTGSTEGEFSKGQNLYFVQAQLFF